jgi:protein-tyrosine phosphatase
MGNICRSPMAQGVLEDRLRRAGLADGVEVDSAGTHAYHVASPPDPRAVAAAAARGIDISGQRARQVAAGDFERFDHVLAMDRDNLALLVDRCPPGARARPRLVMDFAPTGTLGEVPDPYYGGEGGFDQVLDLLESAVDGLVSTLRA